MNSNAVLSPTDLTAPLAEAPYVREDDGRPTTGAPRLPADVVRRLSTPSPLRTWFVVARDYGTIAATVWICEAYWHPALYLLALVMIASRISSLSGLVHEAAHYNLFKSKRWNEWVAMIFASPIILWVWTPKAYRKSHLPHHRYLNTALDPDPAIQGMKKNIEGPWDAFRFFFDGLTLPVVYFAKGFWARSWMQRILALAAAGLFVYAFPTLALKLFMYWIVPLLTFYSLFMFIRLNAEHNAVDSDDTLYRSRTVIPNLLSRLTVAPEYVGYHLAHHVYPSVPFFRRHELHKALLASSENYRTNGHVTRGYLRVIVELMTYKGKPLVPPSKSKTVDPSAQSVRFRPWTEQDGDAFAALSRLCPDTGIVQTSSCYPIHPSRALDTLHPDTVVVVAEAPEVSGLAGAACLSFGDCQLDGHRHPYALFHTLMVHPRLRGRGLASQLTRHTVAIARSRLGKDGLILAHVQEGNAGSLKAVGRSLPRRGGQLARYIAWPRRHAPKPQSGLDVRRAKVGDLEAFATGLNAFYDDYDYFLPQSATSLDQQLTDSPIDQPLRYRYVVVDESGRVLAGLTIFAQGLVRPMEVQRLPGIMSMANRVLHLMPANRIVKQLVVEDAWFAAGQKAAARHLWETIRWELREQGHVFLCMFDPRSPVRDMFGIPQWLPRTSSTVLMDTPVPHSGDRLVYPLV